MVQFPQMAAGLAGNPALKLQLDAQVGFLGALSLRTVDTLQRVTQLNMQLARELVGDSFAACHEVLDCQDPSQVAAVAMRRLQPSGEHLVHYQHGLFSVMAEAQAKLPSPVPAQRGRAAGPG
ncbi:phasin family protein [Massilia yuzhufengensis]|uniref:Phasin family protein n=1 Tax=Massilia yuzhufengensis TaxID=1164594 RepID=A0A1I1EXA0_9BURK|nr:phasin family protein [Massilia yuzhufengensis]SFB91775.1 phasin family protein [Massilia yuzhufengensis]